MTRKKEAFTDMGRLKTAVARSRRIELNKKRRRANYAALVSSILMDHNRHVLTRSNVVVRRKRVNSFSMLKRILMSRNSRGT
jgi:hypothetical protein